LIARRARQGFFGRVDDEISFASLLRHTQSSEWNADILRAEAQEAADTQNHSRDMTIFVQKNVIDFADRVIGRIIDILLVVFGDAERITRELRWPTQRP
jgi:hypothetical protein